MEERNDLALEPPASEKPSLVMNASEAMGLGALEAGMKFAAIYPMTPINALISFFADNAKETGIVYKQPEDEISGIMMALGASLAGARSMVATSGGGFALMVEGLSMAGIVEIPLVIDMGMRVGPATGMPTWTEQGELQFVIHAGHGEFPRIVLAPSDAEEAYSLTIDAFELADRYQVPVFVLTDKYLNESQWCVSSNAFEKKAPKNRGKVVAADALPSDGSFGRFSLDTADGISPRSFPGMKYGEFVANSYEHDEHGFTTEDGKMRTRMADKRLKKFETIKSSVMPPQVYGEDGSDITFVSFGSTRGPILEAMSILSQKGLKTKLVHFPWVYPFPAEEAAKHLAAEKRVIGVEQNGTGQLASLVREMTGIEIREKILKYDGRQLYPEEIVSKVTGA